MTAYRSRFARLLADRGGNFAATTAILLPVLHRLLAVESGAHWGLEWLAGENPAS